MSYFLDQMALTAPTDFVWLVDDDMIPGNKYLGQLMHAAGTELLGSSLLGSIGRVLPRPGRDMSLVSYRKVRIGYFKRIKVLRLCVCTRRGMIVRWCGLVVSRGVVSMAGRTNILLPRLFLDPLLP